MATKETTSVDVIDYIKRAKFNTFPIILSWKTLASSGFSLIQNKTKEVMLSKLNVSNKIAKKGGSVCPSIQLLIRSSLTNFEYVVLDSLETVVEVIRSIDESQQRFDISAYAYFSHEWEAKKSDDGKTTITAEDFDKLVALKIKINSIVVKEFCKVRNLSHGFMHFDLT